MKTPSRTPKRGGLAEPKEPKKSTPGEGGNVGEKVAYSGDMTNWAHGVWLAATVRISLLHFALFS